MKMDEITLQDDQNIESIKAQLETLKRKNELSKLKEELAEASQIANQTPNEFEGSMQIPDTDKVLKTKRKTTSFFDIVFERVRAMLAVRPIVGNIIAIGLAFFAMYYIYNEIQGTVLAKYQGYMGTGMCVFAALQVVKSSTRSILLPILAVMIGSSISHTLGNGTHLLGHGVTFYQYMMGVGIVGIGISVLSID